ncbi:MAG: hypothetical protein HZT40_11210 [Candidatus Thiothrix singaporensis]|uniref:Type IV conjugative transfer system protein TraE n=1 Tax=Candidatus Thiothrix singaporensis TaxID=2799669 RepID=A0A7L6ASL9_9GAMM|nr:MAG: hypothetical protein HZT40_11210 [Candidatus Thiothrix singaporensis]
MKRSTYLSQLADAGYQKGALKLLAGGLLLSNLLLGAILLQASGKAEKTVVVPPDFQRSFWVSGEEVSPDYLEQMAVYYSGLILNYNPANLEYQTRQFLKFADPVAYGELSGKFADDVGKATRNQLSSAWFPQQVDIHGMTLELTGVQTLFVGKNITEQKQRRYRLELDKGAQQPLVRAFQEIPLPNGRDNTTTSNTE